MKIKIDCKNLSNKKNGRKCRISRINKNQLQDCCFIKNGVPENTNPDIAKTYINNLLLICKRAHEKAYDLDHFFDQICPQVDEKIEKIYKNFSP